VGAASLAFFFSARGAGLDAIVPKSFRSFPRATVVPTPGNRANPKVRSNLKLPNVKLPSDFLYVDIFALNASLHRSADPYIEWNHHPPWATRVRFFSVKHSSSLLKK